MAFVKVLLFICLVVGISLADKCSQLNAQHELLYTSKTNENFKNYITGYSVTSDSGKLAFVQTTTSVKGELSTAIQRGRFTESNGGKDQKAVLVAPEGYLGLSVSNFVKATAFKKDSKGMMAIVALQDDEGIKFGRVDSEKKFKKFSEYADTGLNPYVAPFEEEPIYNIEGEIIAINPNISLSIDSSFPVDEKNLQLYLTPFEKNVASLYVLIKNMGSVKLLAYKVSFIDFKLTFALTWKKIVVPQVENVDISGQQAYKPAFIKLAKSGDIVLVANLKSEQKKAFAASTVCGEPIFGDRTQLPFVVIINSVDGAVKHGPTPVAGDEEAKEFYATDFDMEADKMVFSVNTKDATLFDSLVFQKSVDQKPTFGNKAYAIITDTQGDNQVSKLLPVEGGSDYYANAIVFAPESVESRVISGGAVRKQKSLYTFTGRMQLFDYSGEGGKSIKDMMVGEGVSTVVSGLTRAKDSSGKKESVIASMMMNGPTNDYTDKNRKQRNLSSGFWQVDCSQPDKKIELASTILFYIIFGVGVTSLIGGVILFSACCVFDIVKQVVAKKANGGERETLIQN